MRSYKSAKEALFTRLLAIESDLMHEWFVVEASNKRFERGSSEDVSVYQEKYKRLQEAREEVLGALYLIFCEEYDESRGLASARTPYHWVTWLDDLRETCAKREKSNEYE